MYIINNYLHNINLKTYYNEKSIIALMGLFALTACSEDVYQDAEEQNADMNAPPSFNNEDSGQYGAGPWYNWYGINYISPWDIWFRTSNVNGHIDFQPSYLFTNGNVEDVTPYDIRVFAYAGIAYFDGTDDGQFHDVVQVGAPPVHDLTSGNYPNLYANGHEVGNLVRIPVSIDVPAYPAANYSFRIEDKINHLPTIGATNASAKYPFPYSGFNFAGTISPNERELLANYGKIFFYEVHVLDKVTNALVLSTLMHPEIKTLPSGDPDDLDIGWKPVDYLAGNHVYGDVPTLSFSVPLYYFYDDTMTFPGGTKWDISNPHDVNLCDSREVVFDVPMVPHEVDIDGTYKLWLGFQATGQTGWVNSALHLNVTGR